MPYPPRRYKPYTANQPARKPAAPKDMRKSNLGKAFENIVIGACKQYKTLNVADIEKVPTPVQIEQDYGNGKVLGRKEKARFTDFEGILNGGRGIAIEAKECSKATAFPLASLDKHQYEKLKSYHTMGGVAFLLVHRVHYKKVYRMPFEVLYQIWENAQQSNARGSKSIPQEVFDKHCAVVTSNYRSSLHFLEGVI